MQAQQRVLHDLLSVLALAADGHTVVQQPRSKEPREFVERFFVPTLNSPRQIDFELSIRHFTFGCNPASKCDRCDKVAARNQMRIGITT
jgi:hypothetical protein